MFDLFNNREIATAFWTLVIAIFVGKKSSVRKSFGGLLSHFKEPKIFGPILLMAIYVTGSAFLLKLFNLWNISLLKNTVYWFILSGFALLMGIMDMKNSSAFFRKTILGCFAASALIGFILNLYAFPLIGELIFIPVVAFLGVASVYTENPEHAESKILFDGIQTFVGVILLAYIAWSLYRNFQELKPADLLRSILLPIFLTILFLPYLYLLKLIADYETFFLRLKFMISGNEKLRRYVRRKTIQLCHINLFRLRQFEQSLITELWYADSKDKVNELITNFKMGVTNDRI